MNRTREITICVEKTLKEGIFMNCDSVLGSDGKTPITTTKRKLKIGLYEKLLPLIMVLNNFWNIIH